MPHRLPALPNRVFTLPDHQWTIPDTSTQSRRWRVERLLTVRDVVERTRLSRSLVYELLQRGEIPSFAPGGSRRRRIREADLDRWIQKQAQAPGYLGAPEETPKP